MYITERLVWQSKWVGSWDDNQHQLLQAKKFKANLEFLQIKNVFNDIIPNTFTQWTQFTPSISFFCFNEFCWIVRISKISEKYDNQLLKAKKLKQS